MDASQLTLKRISKIALAALSALLVMALLFYKERTLFADTSFYTFNIINFKSFSIQHSRYGAFISQILPFACQKLHLSIKTIIVCYAISFNLFFLTANALIVYRYKQYGLAVLMALYYFLFVSDSYFLLCSEIHQAIAWMFLFFAVTIYMGGKKVNILLLLLPFFLFAFLTISTHFIAIIPMTFLWVYFIVEKKNWPFSKNKSILLSCGLVAVIAVKYLTTASHSYDEAHLHGVTHVSFKDIFESFTRPVVKMFLYRCLVNYWCAVVVFVLGIISLVKDGKKALAAWTCISFIGYIMLMGLSYGDLDNKVLLFHIETEWVSIAIIAATPFVFSFLPKLKLSFAATILTAIFIIRIAYILVAGAAFSLRTDLETRVLAKMKKEGIAKLAFYSDADTRSKFILEWGVPYESLLMSSMNGDKPQLTFCFLNKDDTQTFQAIRDPKKVFIYFGTTNTSSFNPEYFALDSTQPYKIMPYEDFLK